MNLSGRVPRFPKKTEDERLCRELVRRMDGSVSSKEGEGSTFVVDLPFVPTHASEAVAS
jgi:hypothetical protein